MFYAIDKITGEIILSENIRHDNYKKTYNYSLRYICCGCMKNGDKCNDNNVSFVNSKEKTPHFRHSKNTECSASKAFKEFNIDFYNNWFKLFKNEYRKPYWYNINLEEIRNENQIIMIRYNYQNENKIRDIEKYVKENTKIIWILSIENRKYDKIFFDNGKIYIDFIGNKNDIPIFNNNKSIVYVDTGYDILIKVKLESYNYKGQEIELIHINDFCKEYDYFFTAYPYRHKWNKYKWNNIENILKEKEIYDNKIEELLKKYKECEIELKKNNNITENLKSLYIIHIEFNKLQTIYNQINNLDKYIISNKKKYKLYKYI